MFKLDKGWFEILSEVFVNISAAWFMIAVIELQFGRTLKELVFFLTSRFLLGMVALFLAKTLRGKAKSL